LTKEVIGDLTDLLLHIYQYMREGIFPDKLKVAKVEIYKSLSSNYRPISLLSMMDKLFEKRVYKKVYTFLVEDNIVLFKKLISL